MKSSLYISSMVEHRAVNSVVLGSSPRCAVLRPRSVFSFPFTRPWQFFKKDNTNKKENSMGEKNPKKKNQTSFSSTYQPARRRGDKPINHGRHKKSLAREAFEKMGFNPMETQIGLVKMYQDMLTLGIGWNKEPITPKEREQFCNALAKINSELMQYQTTKASANNVSQDSYEEEEESTGQIDRPLNPSELLATRKDMTERANKRLQDKIG